MSRRRADSGHTIEPDREADTIIPRMRRGLVLFAHGARDPSWGRPLHELARLITERDATIGVRVAYLEFHGPDLPAAIAALAPTCTRIDVLPVFWAAAGHVTKDLPALLQAARSLHPALSIRGLPALSELPGLLEFIADLAVAHPELPGPGHDPSNEAAA